MSSQDQRAEYRSTCAKRSVSAEPEYLSGTFRICQLCGFWHFSAFSTSFASMCKHVVTWGGGVCVYFLKSARKHHFRNVWVGGGSHFSAQHNTSDGAHKYGTAPFIHFYSESLSSSAFPFSGRAGTPLAQTSPCLWIGTYFKIQKFMLRSLGGVSFDPKTGQQKRWPQRSSECRAPCGCMKVALNRLHEASWPGRLPGHLLPGFTPRACPFANQRLLWCIWGSNSPWSEFVCRHGSCLLTKRGSRQHRHRPKRTKISNMSSVQHADLGFPNSPFQGLSEYTPHTPTSGTPTGHK